MSATVSYLQFSPSHASAVQASPSQPRLRLTRRGRRVLTGVVSLPLVVAAAVFALNGGGATASNSSIGAQLETVTVLSGQSLWQLAEDVAPSADPREFIADVMAVNGLDSAAVRAGITLAIPAQYSR